MRLGCLRGTRTTSVASSGSAPSLEDWHGNLLWFDQRKGLMLTHVGTLFSVFGADAHAAGLRDTHRTVVHLISRELTLENLPAGTFGPVGTEELIVAKTVDRSVLGV
jgi:hypothetical protein